MIHKIKAMYDNGRGTSIKAIARSLGISRNTVRKYLRLNPDEIEIALAGERHRPFISPTACSAKTTAIQWLTRQRSQITSQ